MKSTTLPQFCVSFFYAFGFVGGFRGGEDPKKQALKKRFLGTEEVLGRLLESWWDNYDLTYLWDN